MLLTKLIIPISVRFRVQPGGFPPNRGEPRNNAKRNGAKIIVCDPRKIETGALLTCTLH